jgi:membrane associated rhomboid family serine protease
MAAFIQMIFTNDPTVPTLGASGAIAAVMGAYFMGFPTARVVSFIPVFFLPWIVEIPAIIYLGIWFASQLWSGLTSMVSASASVGGVAWWAHIGGFAFGLLISSSLLRTQQKQNPYPINPYPKT